MESGGKTGEVNSTNAEASTFPITVLFRAIGEAPALQKNKYKVNAGPGKTLLDVELFLRKLLSISSNASLYVYCGPGFAPTPDQKLRDLFECFASSNGELSIYYGFQQTWG